MLINTTKYGSEAVGPGTDFNTTCETTEQPLQTNLMLQLCKPNKLTELINKFGDQINQTTNKLW